MMRHIKVSTGMLAVLGAFVIALLVSIAAGWYGAKESDAALSRLNAVSNEQTARVQEIYNILLRSRVALAGALAEVQEGQTEQAATSLQRTDKFLNDARASFRTFRAAPKQDEGERLAQAMQQPFDAYVAGVAAQREALLANDTGAYVSANLASRQASGLFDKAMREFVDYVSAVNVGVLENAHQRYMLAQALAVALLAVAAVIGFLCWTFISRGVLGPLRQAGDTLDRIAGGDLTTRLDYKSNNEIGVLFGAMRRMQEGLTRTVSTVRRGVLEVDTGAREISAGNTDLSSRTEQQAAALEETAASMEELASTVKQNAENARQANTLAASASSVAVRGGNTVGQVVETMQQIAQSSRKISEIVSVIESIAFQTNILALNAAVESARAGEQGKGFAVVAGEVRALAQRSAQAAREIKELINDSSLKVNAGSAQVEAAGGTMEEIVASVKRVADIIGEIAAASEEQASGIDQVNQAVSQMDETTQQNAALVEEAAAAAGSLEQQAKDLGSAVAVFKIGSGEVVEVDASETGRQLGGGSVRVQYAG